MAICQKVIEKLIRLYNTVIHVWDYHWPEVKNQAWKG